MMEGLFNKIAEVLALETLSDELKENLTAERVNEKSLVRLTETDLKELGFRIGERRLLTDWINLQRVDPVAKQVEPVEECNTPVSSRVTVCSTPESPATPVSVRTPTGRQCRRIEPCKFKDCEVDVILSQHKMNNGAVIGSELSNKLKERGEPTEQERRFLIRTMGRYLMNNCARLDDPSPAEKEDMAASIVNTFEVLKDGTPTGYAGLYDRGHWTGSLETYCRNRRSNCSDIVTKWTVKRPTVCPEQTNIEPEVLSAAAQLREQRPNVHNQAELLKLMATTRPSRRSWIKKDSPSITEILKRFPRFQDMPDAVREEFQHVAQTTKRLHVEWQAYKPWILKLASTTTKVEGLVNGLTEDMDEDEKSLLSFKCLSYLLPSPPTRGAKRPRLSKEAVLELLFVDYEEETVDQALASLADKNILQPILFRVGSQYFVKTDATAINIADCSCFTEALEFLFMCFFVFSVQYPPELRLFFGFVERVLGTKVSSKSSTIIDLMRKLTGLRENAAD